MISTSRTWAVLCGAAAIVLAILLGWGLVEGMLFPDDDNHDPTRILLRGAITGGLLVGWLGVVLSQLGIPPFKRLYVQQALAESEERYRLLFAHAPHPMWVYDLDTLQFLAVNDAAVRTYGYTAEEFLTLTIADIRPRDDLSSLKNITKTLQRVDKTGVWRHSRKDGTLLDVEVTSYELPFGNRRARLVNAQDVTEQRKAIRALRESEERYRRTFEKDITGCFISTPDGRLLDCNPAFVRIFGFSSAAAARNASVVTLHQTPEDREKLLARLRSEKHIQGLEMRLRKQDGQPVHVVISLDGQFSAAGELEQIQGYCFDITELKRLEAELRQVHKMEAVGRLAGGIAHEFNNLMAVILGYTALLQEDLSDEGEHRQYLAEIQRAGDRAATLTRQLLAFGRRQVLAPDLIDVNSFLRRVEPAMHRAIGLDAKLVLDLHPSAGRVKADPAALEQVILSLVLNAREALASHGQITISTRAVALQNGTMGGSDDSENHTCIAVSDTGRGIEPSRLDHIFEPFFTTKEVGQGPGLGLAMVYGIVHEIGGQVDVQTEVGRGTTVRVFLPCANAGGTDASADSQPVDSAAPAQIRPHHQLQ